jgi:hypothetical protein
MDHFVKYEVCSGGEAEAELAIYLAILTNSRKIFCNRNRVEKKYYTTF